MTSTEDNKPRMYKIRSFDGTELEISEAAIILSETLKVAINSDFNELSVIHIPRQDLTADILEKVISYCTKHAEFAAAPEPDDKKTKLTKEAEINAWDKKFIDVSEDILCEFLIASDYLEVKGLLELSMNKVANLIKENTVEEIRATYYVINDFTSEKTNLNKEKTAKEIRAPYYVMNDFTSEKTNLIKEKTAEETFAPYYVMNDFTSEKANLIKEKTAEEIRAPYYVMNDFTSEKTNLIKEKTTEVIFAPYYVMNDFTSEKTNLIKEKTAKEIRAPYYVMNDFTSEKTNLIKEKTTEVIFAPYYVMNDFTSDKEAEAKGEFP